MELIKNLLKYFVILLVLIFCIFGILAGIMFLFPSVNLFGFRFAGNRDSSAIIINSPTINEVEVETNNFDIVIMPNIEKDVENNNRLRMVISNNYTGFSNAKYNKETINNTLVQNIMTGDYVEYKEFKAENLTNFNNGGKYTIKIKEPTGLISYGDSKVIIYVPENAENIVYNLKTNTGSIIFAKNSLKSTKTINTSDITLNVSSYRGSFNLDNAKMADNSNLTVSNYLGRVKINSEKIANVVINSNSGNFTFKNIGHEEFAGNLTVNGNNPYVRVNTVFGNVNFDATTGYIEAKEIKGDSILNTENGIIKINKALGGITSSNNSGDTIIKQIGENTTDTKAINISSKSGSITLGGDEENEGVYYLTKIDTRSGRVSINNMYAVTRTVTNVDYNVIETTKGSVSVNFADTLDEKYLKVTTSSGAIRLKNINGEVDAKTSHSSKIYAEFSRFAVGKISNFRTDEGTVELVMPDPTESKDKQYVLNFQNRYNNIKVEVGDFEKTSFDGDKDPQGYYNFTKTFPENANTTNTINVKTNSGKIIVKEK